MAHQLQKVEGVLKADAAANILIKVALKVAGRK